MSRENNRRESASSGWQREELSAEKRGESGGQELQWRTVLNALLPVLPVLAIQLRDIAQEGESMVIQVSTRFFNITEKIEESCGPRERNGTEPNPVAATPTSSEAVVLEINRIVTALQFQDAASQRLEHFAKLMEEIASVLSRWMAASPEHRQNVDVGGLAWAERMRNLRPTGSSAVRELLAGSSPSTSADNDYEYHGKVELF